MPRGIEARALHKLAEDIYDALEREGYWDEPRSRRRAIPGKSGGRRKQIRYEPTRAKRRPSKSQLKYGRMFKKMAPRYKKKNGSWKKDGFKRCVRAAHRACK